MRRHMSFARLAQTTCFVAAAFFIEAIFSSVPTVAAEITFPYKARITTDDVYVRSGPGRNYYPTDKLQVGQEVEVYRHDPGGWYAIRPPQGSFSWVSSHFVDVGRDGLADITSDHVAAMVGSRFSKIRDVVQIRLHKGEIVEPISLPTNQGLQTNASDAKDWIKIAPPSGEFRWVSAKYVDRNFETSGIRKTSSGNSSLTNDLRRGELLKNGTAPLAQGENTSGQSIVVETALPSISPEEFQKRLDDVDLELSVMVAEEPTVWQFDDLATEAQSLLNRAETAIQRGQARVFLGKINRFANIKQRYDAVNTLWCDTQNSNTLLADLRRQYGDIRARFSSDGSSGDSRFDGRGRLTRVVSPKPGAPRYALVDESGNLQCYVTPAPGVNLRHYEQRVIGVNGTRGYVPEQRAAHIMAQHVDLLNNDGMDRSATKLR